MPSPPDLPRAELSRLADSLVREGVAPDVALGFARGGPAGGVVCGGNAQTRVFDLASLTKPMTAVACVEAGISPETRLVDVAPEFAGTAAAEATLELLLSHRAGLEAHVPLYLSVVSGELSRDAALRFAANSKRADARDPAGNEGHPPVYSDLGYMLAGMMLARVAGCDHAGDAIERLVVQPWQLQEHLGTAASMRAQGANFVPTEDVPWRNGVVAGAVHDENAWILTGSGASGHAGMFGTVEGVLRFGKRVLEASDRYGWLLRARPGGTHRAGFDGKSPDASSAGTRMSGRAFGHLGFTGTSLWIDPVHQNVVSLLTNRVHPTRANLRIKEARPVVHDELWRLANETYGTKLLAK